jgi:hypothetical protein
MGTVTHAEKEFDVLGWPGDCEMQGWACENVLELLEVFAEQGHSGSSAPYVLNLFNKLAKFKPISPLTGEDNEWTEVGEEVFQNKRDSAVFKKGKDGKAYWLDGRIFKDKNGSTFTSNKSSIPVKFPWIRPESKIVPSWKQKFIFRTGR